jgi:uncharacterized protein YdaU (DUF1376 family)
MTKRQRRKSSPEDVCIWMPHYNARYLAETVTLTAEEDSAYFRLLMHYWTRGPFAPDHRIGLVMKPTANAAQVAKRVLDEFFVLEGGVYHHPWLRERKEEAQNNKASAQNAAIKRWEQEREKQEREKQEREQRAATQGHAQSHAQGHSQSDAQSHTQSHAQSHAQTMRGACTTPSPSSSPSSSPKPQSQPAEAGTAPPKKGFGGAVPGTKTLFSSPSMTDPRPSPQKKRGNGFPDRPPLSHAEERAEWLFSELKMPLDEATRNYVTQSVVLIAKNKDAGYNTGGDLDKGARCLLGAVRLAQADGQTIDRQWFVAMEWVRYLRPITDASAMPHVSSRPQ